MSSLFKNCGLICILLKLFSKSYETNVALNMMSDYCSDQFAMNKMFDGIKTLDNFEQYTEECPVDSYVFIDLVSDQMVNYVIVYEGEGNDYGQLDHFVVRFYSMGNPICSEYPGKANLPDKSRGLRVNCINRNVMYSKIIIFSRKTIGFTITEIEIHTLGTPQEKLMIPFGCYSSFGSNIEYIDLVSCVTKCASQNFTLAGIKDNRECACSNELHENDEIETSLCDVPCPEHFTQRHCGGKESYSAYLIASVLPFYRGCLLTSEDFIQNSVNSGDMTIVKCLHMCDHKRFALLQSGNYCICQDSVDERNILYETTDCSIPCTGDDTMTCGDTEAASVFATCSYDNEAVYCAATINCQEKYDMYGYCGGVCYQGFRGDHCLERIYKAERRSTSTARPCTLPDPCLDQPNTVCTVVQGKEKCMCMEGYKRDDDYDYDEDKECKDINECEHKACDSLTTDCVNLIGSYECLCKKGFVKFTNDVCLSNTTSDDLKFPAIEEYLWLIFLLIALTTTMICFCLNATVSTESASRPSRQSQNVL